MVEAKGVIQGQVYNFSLNKSSRKPVLGWYIIVTGTGEECLVKRNFSFSSNWSRQIYQTNISMQEFLISVDEYEAFYHKHGGFYGIGIGIALGSLLRLITPLEFWFGKYNENLSPLSGGIGVISMLIMTFLWLWLLSSFRKIKLMKMIKNKGGYLSLIGKVKSQTPIKVLPTGMEFW